MSIARAAEFATVIVSHLWENAMRKYRLSEEQRAFSYQEDGTKKVCYYGRLPPLAILTM